MDQSHPGREDRKSTLRRAVLLRRRSLNSHAELLSRCPFAQAHSSTQTHRETIHPGKERERDAVGECQLPLLPNPPPDSDLRIASAKGPNLALRAHRQGSRTTDYALILAAKRLMSSWLRPRQVVSCRPNADPGRRTSPPAAARLPALPLNTLPIKDLQKRQAARPESIDGAPAPEDPAHSANYAQRSGPT